MIDQCIIKIYQRDKKVFIPEFGAIIYSEFNDKVDFNELLTFDDGKVIKEIQNQQTIPEEDARKALNKYIQKIKNTLKKGKSQFIGGIGYIVQDEQGSIKIQKEKPSNDISKKTIKSASPISEEISNEGNQEETEVDQIKKDTKEQEIEIQGSTDLLEEDTVSETSIFEKAQIFPAEDNEDDENIFSMEIEDKFVDENETEINGIESERRSGLKIALLIIVPLLLITAGAYYFLNFTNTDKAKDNPNQIASVESIPKKSVLESPEKAKDGLKSDVTSHDTVTPVSNAQIDQIDEDKTFCLIMGSFKVESNADNYQQRLKQKGLESYKFKGRKKFYFVGIQKIEGKSNAVKQLTEIKRQIPSAWIYNKDLLL